MEFVVYDENDALALIEICKNIDTGDQSRRLWQSISALHVMENMQTLCESLS